MYWMDGCPWYDNACRYKGRRKRGGGWMGVEFCGWGWMGFERLLDGLVVGWVV